MESFEIRDPVHGFITLDRWEKNIVDHPVFQRLRRIRQLAWTDMVYPGAMHTRFEHSLGVMHIATEMYKQIVKKKKDLLRKKLGFDDSGFARELKLIRLACLLHDVGHPPFSHAGESLMEVNPNTGKRYTHEDYSSAIVKYKLRDVIENHPLNDNYKITVKEISDFLRGSSEAGRLLLWRSLVTGQIDADRADYLLRDSYHIGVNYGSYDLKRLLVTLTISEHPETGAPIIAVEEGGLHAAESLIIARYLMFTQVYFHHTRRAFDHHIEKVIKNLLLEDINQETFFPPTSEENIDHFLSWDDWRVLGLISQNKGGQDSDFLKQRKHHRCVFHTSEIPTEEELDQANLIRSKLGKLVCFVDEPQKSWYSTGEKDIMIEFEKAERKIVVPLSSVSSIAKGLLPIRQRRIYVAKENQKRVEKIINKFLREESTE